MLCLSPLGHDLQILPLEACKFPDTASPKSGFEVILCIEDMRENIFTDSRGLNEFNIYKSLSLNPNFVNYK